MRERRRLSAGRAAMVLGFLTQGCCLFSAPPYRGPKSERFDGRRFHNEPAAGTRRSTFLGFLRWQLGRDPGPWSDFTDAEPGPAPPARVGPGRMRVTFVGHSTVLVQMDGVNLLLDPVWSPRVGPVAWAGPHRVRPPGLRLEDLPPIDAVLISHNHYDHLDVPTLRRLAARHPHATVTGLGNAELLRRAGLGGAVELDWWQETDVAGLHVAAVPASHFSGRGLCDSDRTQWVGFVVRGAAGSFYFAGDTGFGPHFEDIRRRLGRVRLALLPIGAYRPEWFMGPVHISPDEAVVAARILGAGTSVAVHFGTFRQGDDGEHEAPRRLEEALTAEGARRPRFWVLGFGEGRDVPELEP